MPKSLRCKIKKLCYNGALTERERDRILKALEQEDVQSSSNEFFNFDAPMVKNSEKVSSKMCEICKKPESEWDMSESPFAFAYTTKDSCTEKYYCPSCLARRLLKVLKDNKQEDNNANSN